MSLLRPGVVKQLTHSVSSDTEWRTLLLINIKQVFQLQSDISFKWICAPCRCIWSLKMSKNHYENISRTVAVTKVDRPVCFGLCVWGKHIGMLRWAVILPSINTDKTLNSVFITLIGIVSHTVYNSNSFPANNSNDTWFSVTEHYIPAISALYIIHILQYSSLSWSIPLHM